VNGAIFTTNTQREFTAPFPLTPALSLGERENLSPSLDGLSTARISPPLVCLNEKPDAGDVTETFRIIRDGQLRFPLPKGEGQGEGEGSVRTRKAVTIIS